MAHVYDFDNHKNDVEVPDKVPFEKYEEKPVPVFVAQPIKRNQGKEIEKPAVAVAVEERKDSDIPVKSEGNKDVEKVARQHVDTHIHREPTFLLKHYDITSTAFTCIESQVRKYF